MSINANKFELFKKEFGENLKKIRLRKNFSQLDLAVRCDFEKTTISRIENSRTNVTLKTIFILADALEVEIKELFDLG